MNRQHFLQEIESALRNECEELDSALLSLKHDIENDTKSSAGDKFETAREMAQQERVKLESAKATKLQFLNQLKQLDKEGIPEKIVPGTFVRTNHGLFLLGLPVGKIVFENDDSCFGLGLNSPISKLLMDKKINDSFTLQERTYEVLELC